MSGIQTYSGKLVKVQLENQTPEEYFKNKFPDADLTFYKSYTDYVIYEISDYIIVNNEVWEVQVLKSLDENNFLKFNYDSETEIFDFITSYYDGGTCLEEILYEMVKDTL